MSRISLRRPLSDRIANIAGCTWIAGLVLWYAGGSTAIDRTVQGETLFIPVAILSLIGGAIALIKEPRLDKGAFGTAAFLALGLVLLGFDLAALINRYAGGSTARAEHSMVLSFQKPAKGPRTVTVALDGARISFQASHAEGCEVGERAELKLRAGALGAEWLDSIRCD